MKRSGVIYQEGRPKENEASCLFGSNQRLVVGDPAKLVWTWVFEEVREDEVGHNERKTGPVDRPQTYRADSLSALVAECVRRLNSPLEGVTTIEAYRRLIGGVKRIPAKDHEVDKFTEEYDKKSAENNKY
ncbi:MAG: hypothetical protein WC796_00715 [Candidatus Pacearchaeota archaeon]|jgi:hypothetical protein